MVDPRTNIPTAKSVALDWKKWHESLIAYGVPVSDANRVWKAYWDRYATSLTDDQELRAYMQSYGVDISGTLDRIQDATTGAISAVTGTIKGIVKGGMFLTLGVGAILIFAILKAVLNIAKNPVGAANAASNFTPAKGIKK
jgi:hypothetical protein